MPLCDVHLQVSQFVSRLHSINLVLTYHPMVYGFCQLLLGVVLSFFDLGANLFMAW